MTDIMATVAAGLEAMGITYVTKDDTLTFDLPFGSTRYDCAIWSEESDSIVLSAVWDGLISPDRIDEARRLLVQLTEVGDGGGWTLLDKRSGLLFRQLSIDVSMIQFAPAKLYQIVEAALDPFNVKIFALGLVLEGRMKAHEAVDTYAAWERERRQDRMAKLRLLFELNKVDPTSN